ncbi:MAG: NADH-quinone oxidoreductase subunit C [Nitrososphaerales archaeon]
MSQQKTQELPKVEKSIVDSTQSALGQNVSLVYAKPNRIKFQTEASNIETFAVFLRDELHFDHCTNVTGTDFPKENKIQIDYQFGSLGREECRSIIFTISSRVDSTQPIIPSLVQIYPSAELHERETAEMLGVNFTGHPNLSRLLLPEDWNDIPPMLKKYRLPGRLEGE